MNKKSFFSRLSITLIVSILFVTIGYLSNYDILTNSGVVIALIQLIIAAYTLWSNNLKFLQLGVEPSRITPVDIIKDRGEIHWGFNEKVYRERDIDKELKTLIEKRNQQPSIITISGGKGSGKSRAVYYFIKSTLHEELFKCVYVVKSNNIKTIADNLKSTNASRDLLIIDEVNLFLDEDLLSLRKILRTVHNSKAKVAILTYANEDTVDLEIKNIDDWINKNVPESNPESRPIKHIEIPDIEFGDEVYNWCMANMYPIRPFSPVIGAYVKELRERIDDKTEQLFKMQDAIDVLTAYKTMAIYRKNCSQKLQYTFLMYTTQQEDKTLENFNNGLKQIINLGYISIKNSINDTTLNIEKKDGAKIKQNEDLEWYRKHIIDETIICKTQTVVIKDRQLLEEFMRRIEMEKFGKKNETTRKFLLHNKESEINRIKALIRIDPNDPVYYSRAITKATNSEFVINEVVRLLHQNRVVSETKEILIQDSEKVKLLSQLISIIIGRKRWTSFDALKNEVEEFIQGGLVPDEVFISELLRIIIYEPILKNDIYSFVNDLVGRYSLVPDIYYHQRIEEIEQDLNIHRVMKASAFLPKPTDDYLDELAYSRYCAVLLQKATTQTKMDILFDDILPAVKAHISHTLKFSRSNLENLMRRFRRSNDFSKGDLLLYLIKKLQTNMDCLRDCSIQVIYLSAIKQSDTFSSAKKIYDVIITSLAEEKKLQRVIALSLFEKIEEKNDFNLSLEILDELTSNKTEKGSNLKLLNKLLAKTPSFDKAIALFRSTKYQVDRDIYTVNSLFKVIFRNKGNHLNHSILDQLTEYAIVINTIRKDYNIPADGIFLSNFYYIAQCYLSGEEITPVPDSISEIIAELKKEYPIVINPILEAQELRALPFEEVLKRAKAIVNDMETGIAKDADIITSLLNATIMYKNEELGKIVNRMIDMQDQISNRSIHYHCKRIVMNMEFNQYTDNGKVDLALLKNDILSALMDLNNNLKPLFDTHVDIFCAVINRLSYNDAKEILLYSRDLSHKYRHINDFGKVFRSRQIFHLCRKIEESDINSIEQMGEIQDLINQNPNIRFNEEERRKINNINQKIRNGKPPILYIPLLSTNRNIRHQTWDYMVLNGSIDNTYAKDIQTFIKMEITDMMHHSRSPKKINETYLIQALKTFRKKRNKLDSFVNQDGYLKLRSYNPNATYDNFFKAFVYLKCIRPENLHEWNQLAATFGYPLEEI